MLARQIQQPVREIVYRTRGHTHGPITRLMSPSDLGEILKPFVFLDLAGFDGRFAPMPMGFGWHPHSGIATVTVMLEEAVRYAETTGQQGAVGRRRRVDASRKRCLACRRSRGGPRESVPAVGRPAAALENAANASHYVMPKDVPVEGPVRVVLGEYGNAKSPIAAPPMSYLAVNLGAGERWTYHPPKGHTVAWVAVHEGVLRISSPIPSGEIAIFEPSEESIDFIAEGNTGFVLGSAAKHPHDLVLGNYSVHTTAEALRQGETEIRRIGQRLRADGTLRR